MRAKYLLYNFFYVWRSIFRNIKANGELLKQFVYISLTGQFKKTILGNAWLVFDPILSLIIWLMLHRSGVFDPGHTEIPYPAYILINISIWTFFSAFFDNIGKSVSESGQMLLEVSFPLEVKVAEKILINIINFTIPLLVILIVLPFLGVHFKLSSFLIIPALIPLVLFGTGIGMFFSLIEVVLHDIFVLMKRTFRLLMYITPVVYSNDVNSSLLQKIIKHNPLTYLISVPRDLLIGIKPAYMQGFWISTLIVTLFFIIVVQFYYFSVNKIVEKILE